MNENKEPVLTLTASENACEQGTEAVSERSRKARDEVLKKQGALMGARRATVACGAIRPGHEEGKAEKSKGRPHTNGRRKGEQKTTTPRTCPAGGGKLSATIVKPKKREARGRCGEGWKRTWGSVAVAQTSDVLIAHDKPMARGEEDYAREKRRTCRAQEKPADAKGIRA